MFLCFSYRRLPALWFFCSLLLLGGGGLFAQDTEREIWDPIEPVNRGIFWFNQRVDKNVLKPVARGYDYVVPDEVQGGVTDFFRNLSYPGYVLNDVLVLDFEGAAVHTGRFLINTVLGVGGIFDVASEFDLEHKETDFGVTLARYGIGHGPYLVLPFLGPSSLRDTVGRAADSYVDPFTLIAYTDISDDEFFVTTSLANGMRLINKRSLLLDALDSAEEGSLDYYLTLRSAYVQTRKGLMPGRTEELDELDDDDFLAEE